MSDGRIIVMRGAAWQWHPGWFTPKRCREIEARNPTAYRTDVLNEFVTPESNLLSSTCLAAATRSVVLPRGCIFRAAMDPATRGNSWTLVIVARKPTTPATYAVAAAVQWTGSKQQPLSPEAVMVDVAAICGPFAIKTIVSDQWLFDSIVDIARKNNLNVEKRDPNTAERVELYETLRLEIEAGRLELPDVKQLREDLLRVKKKVTQTGITIDLPKTADGRHCDFAPSVVLALEAAMHTSNPLSIRAMEDLMSELGPLSRWGEYDFGHGFG